MHDGTGQKGAPTMAPATRATSKSVTFSGALELDGKTATGITVPPEVLESLGSHKRPAVLVTLGAHTYATTLGVMAGVSKIPVSAENRTRAGLVAGDRVQVTLELDAAPQAVAVPADLAAALDATPRARAAFDGLTHSRRKWLVAGSEGAKAEATRTRRIAKAVAELASA
jgi:hypothetical protein